MILLDTHVALWWATEPSRISPRVVRELATSERIHISPATCWEIAELVAIGRIELDRDVHVWMHGLCTKERVTITPIDPAIATSAGMLPGQGFPGDTADSLIYATARTFDLPLATKDRRLRDHARLAGDVRCIW
ncbi:MAG: type II toxin-antitoxin system VapC family toxin [Acidimicrobiia bacterium]